MSKIKSGAVYRFCPGVHTLATCNNNYYTNTAFTTFGGPSQNRTELFRFSDGRTTTTLAQDPLFLVGDEGNAPSSSGCKPDTLLLS